MAAILFLQVVLCLPVFAQQRVIVNPDVDVSRITRNQARLFYTMRQTQWSDGQHVQVFVLSDDAGLHGDFVKNILELYPRQLRRVWNRLLYSGTGQAPNQVESTEEMLYQVANTPGAIGYLPEELVNGDVKVLEVQP